MKIIYIILFLALWVLLEAFSMEIVLPQSATLFEQTAAEELQIHLEKAYGEKPTVVQEGKEGGGIRIYVGDTALARRNNIDCNKMGQEEWRVKSIGPKAIVVAGGTPRGVIYSAYELLERLYGLMWLDDVTTVIPKSALAEWPAGLEISGRPDFALRGVYNYWNDMPKQRQLSFVRNRQNFFHGEEDDRGKVRHLEKYGVFKVYGSPAACHTYYYYTKDIPPEDEDCLSLNSAGRRDKPTSSSGPGQICLSNPKTLRLFEKRLRGFIERDRKTDVPFPPYIYEISANDNSAECQCDGCRELRRKYGCHAGAVLDFTNRLGEAIESDYPEIFLQMFAYHNATEPPNGIKGRRNVIVRLAQLGHEYAGHRDSSRLLTHPNNRQAFDEYSGWTECAANLSIWDYWTNFGNSGMVMFYDVISENLKLYRKGNVRNFFVEHELPMVAPFYPLRNWLARRFLNDTSLDLDKETDRFMAAYYGEKSAPAMKALLELIVREQDRNQRPLGHTSVMRRVEFTREFFAECDKLIAKALAAAEDEECRRHIVKERAVVHYAKFQRFQRQADANLDEYVAQIRADVLTAAVPWMPRVPDNYISRNIDLILESSIELPKIKEVDGRKVIHQLAWTDRMQYSSKPRLVKMDDALGGKAQFCKDSKYTGCEFGYYINSEELIVGKHNLSKEQLHQDGKFHFYKIGKVTLKKGGFFFMHRSWETQWYTDHVLDENGDNTYIAYISLKVTGPAYVRDSKEKDSAIYSDCVVLAEAQP